MKARHGPPAVVLVIFLSGLIFVLLVSASTIQKHRHIISSGGGLSSNSGTGVYSSIGQPVAGVVSNGINLCSGHVCGQATGPMMKKIYLLFTAAQYTYEFSAKEGEDYDDPAWTNTLIRPNRTYNDRHYTVNKGITTGYTDGQFDNEWAARGQLTANMSSITR